MRCARRNLNPGANPTHPTPPFSRRGKRLPTVGEESVSRRPVAPAPRHGAAWARLSRHSTTNLPNLVSDSTRKSENIRLGSDAASLSRKCLLCPNAYGLSKQPQGRIRVYMRGKGMASRMCSMPQIQRTVRSKPMPNPEWGTVPNRRRSMYQSNTSSGRSCS